MRTRWMFLLLFLTGAVVAVATAGSGSGEPKYTTEFALERCPRLVPYGGNLYFPLQTGLFRRYEGEDEDGSFVELEITVLRKTRTVEFEVDDQWKKAETRVIQEREWVDGELVEESWNYFACCTKTGNVFYFGEEVDIYEDGEVVSHDGAWLAGEDDAEPGLIMPSVFLLGSRYFQEIAPDVALDRAEHVEMDLEIETEAGDFEDCVMVVETTPLEPGHESIKIYAPGVGLIVDSFLEIVEVEYD